MNVEKRWLALELPPQTLNEIAEEAMRLGSTPSSLLSQAWGRSAYLVSDGSFDMNGTRIATRVILDTTLADRLIDAASDHDTSVSALMAWAWERQRGYFRTRRTGSLIAIS